MAAEQGRAQQLIVGCLAASTAIAAGSMLAEDKQPGARLLIGVAVTGVGLSTAAMFAPGFAGGLAVLVLTTTVLTYGQPLFDLLSKRTAPEAGGDTSTSSEPGTTTGVPAQRETAKA